MLPLDDRIFRHDNDFYVSLGDSLWLMDNHKWAFVIWNSQRIRKSIYLLVHIDYHWDSCYDYWQSPEKEKQFLAASDTEILEIVREENYIKYDSFICPAIAKGFIDEVHFYCRQGDKSGDIAIFTDFLNKFGYKQVLHSTTKTLSKLKSQKPIIFDFCLDIFNSSNTLYESDIWSDDKIDHLLHDCKPLVKSAEIVTISMSYGFSGTEDDTKK